MRHAFLWPGLKKAIGEKLGGKHKHCDEPGPKLALSGAVVGRVTAQTHEQLGRLRVAVAATLCDFNRTSFFKPCPSCCFGFTQGTLRAQARGFVRFPARGVSIGVTCNSSIDKPRGPFAVHRAVADSVAGVTLGKGTWRSGVTVRAFMLWVARHAFRRKN